MTTLNDFNRTDLLHDHVAGDVNKLIATALRAEYANTETITATKELADTDTQYQIITASGADRTVELAPAATTNHITLIYNAGASNNVPVKDSAGAITYATLRPDDWALAIPFSGEGWKVIKASALTEAQVNTISIEGLKLTWNSATSITVGVGSCYAENGDFIDVTSDIVKSSLSLSTSTFYHVYVFLSGGVAAAEVVAGAPVAWKGNAYSKTGDTTRRYVGSILSDASANVRNFVHDLSLGAILYRKFRSDTSPHRALNGGTATVATAVALATIIPVTAVAASIRVTNLSDRSMYTSEDNGVATTQNTVALTAGNTATQSAFLFHLVDSSLQIFYIFASGISTGAGYMDVLGYTFRR